MSRKATTLGQANLEMSVFQGFIPGEISESFLPLTNLNFLQPIHLFVHPDLGDSNRRHLRWPISSQDPSGSTEETSR